MENNKELKNDELNAVSGGSGNNQISINRNDYCKHNPSRFFEFSGSFSLPSDMQQCKLCAYNSHRDWENSTCDYPNKHN